ncbi:MAG: preprotein translocase subunit SecE [Candidatus Melainabacteria bacterium]|nr:preprotein translocase subunit SecE [Candidatus Melainabacteria bacterium]
MVTIVNEKETQVEKAEIKAEPVNILTFLKEVRTEFLKISWPSREQVSREFFSVILLVTILAGIIFLIDRGLSLVLNFFNGRV